MRRILISAFAQAPTQPPPGARPAETDRFPAPPAVEKLQQTQHSIQINGKTLAYTTIFRYGSSYDLIMAAGKPISVGICVQYGGDVFTLAFVFFIPNGDVILSQHYGNYQRLGNGTEFKPMGFGWGDLGLECGGV